jgi:probable selenium-dependent hydroxylase accessory protein YqeC
MESLNDCFEDLNQRCITVIGCGGKTSLIQFLAQSRQDLKTLVTTTTRMGIPSQERSYHDYFWAYPPQDDAFQLPSPGITLGGIANQGVGKLESLPLDILVQILPWFDRVLIEGDGSRTLPLKAWADYEPVIPPFTTVTIGILPLWTLGMPVSETIIHRLPLFSALTGAQPGDEICLHHLVSVITGNFPNQNKGLFSAAQGKEILFF